MSAQDTAAQLVRLAQQLAAEAASLSSAEASAVQAQVGDALAALAGTVCGLAQAQRGAGSRTAGSNSSHAASTGFNVSMPIATPVMTPPDPTPAAPTMPAPSGGGLKISLGGSTSGGGSGGGISLGTPASTSIPSSSSSGGGGKSGLDAAKNLSRFREFIEKAQIAVPAGDLAFTSKAAQIIEGLPEAERNSSKVAKLLGDCIGFIDKIIAENWAEGLEDLVRAANETQKALADYLHSHGIEVIPVPGEGVPAAQNAGAETIELIHPAVKGTPLVVARHGLRVNGALAVKPAILVASGTPGDVLKSMVAGVAALVKPHGGHPAEAKIRAQSIKELRNLGKQIVGADEEKQRQICQYAINAIHNGNPDKSLDGVENKLVDVLKGAGYSEIYVGIGQKFDESYSPSKYERRKLSSDKDLGTIIGVQQRGFLNKSGVPVQKAIVLVSG